jgi:hypothetical protein
MNYLIYTRLNYISLVYKSIITMKINFEIPINKFTNEQYYLTSSIITNKKLYVLIRENKQLIKVIDNIIWYLYKKNVILNI